jgi:hypothetical protein
VRVKWCSNPWERRRQRGVDEAVQEAVQEAEEDRDEAVVVGRNERRGAEVECSVEMETTWRM